MSVEKAEDEELEDELAVAYVLEMSNNTLIIGLSCHFDEEIRRITDETNLDIKNFCTSSYMPYLDAWHLKCDCENRRLTKNMKGEFGSFEDVKAVLLSSPVDKLLEIAREMEPSPEKKYSAPSSRRSPCIKKKLKTNLHIKDNEIIKPLVPNVDSVKQIV